ncbi:hypothetical protein BASA81_017197 [Batrachochytrium salamandrivorans]|nr:hypothetical protein BASA81_017197 [Batrachochytrium salamandrivorans]
MVDLLSEEVARLLRYYSLASVAGSIRMRFTDSDRSVRATPKKARDASPPPQDDLWVVVKNLSQQVAAQQADLDALRNTIAFQQRQQLTGESQRLGHYLTWDPDTN